MAEASWECRKHQQRFTEGDQVWLEGQNIHTSHPTAKLAPKRYGPFPITKVLGPVTYQLHLSEQWSIHLVFHVDLLTPYKEMEFHGRNFERLLLDLINGEEEYEVEHIVDSRRFGCGHQVQYLVHWKGYLESDDQWILWSDLTAPELLADFQRENPDAVVHIRTSRSNEEMPTPTIPPTSLPPILHNFVYMSNGSAPLPTSSALTQGRYLDLYDMVAAEVSNNTASSAIIQRIMAITVAAATSGTPAASSGEEDDDNRDEGVFADTHSGPDNDGMVLAGTSAQSAGGNAMDPTR